MARPLNPDLELFERGVFARLSGVDAGYGPATVLVGIDFEIRTGEVAIITDAHGSAGYKRELLRVTVRRAVQQASASQRAH